MMYLYYILDLMQDFKEAIAIYPDLSNVRYNAMLATEGIRFSSFTLLVKLCEPSCRLKDLELLLQDVVAAKQKISLCLGNIAILAALQWFLSGKWIDIFDVQALSLLSLFYFSFLVLVSLLFLFYFRFLQFQFKLLVLSIKIRSLFD